MGEDTHPNFDRFEVNREHQSVHVPLSGSVSFDRLKNGEQPRSSFPAEGGQD